MSIRAMVKRAGLLAAAVVSLGVFAGGAVAAARPGEAAPDFAAVDSKGNPVKLGDFRGKTVILEWTNHGCPYVQKHYRSGNMQALQKDMTGKGMVWLSVISSAPGEEGHVGGAEADKLTSSRFAAPSAVLLDPDGKIGRLYDARATPHMFIVTPDGKLAYAGAIDDKPSSNVADLKIARNYVRNALDQIAAGKPVSPALTRAYGCSVKYKGS